MEIDEPELPEAPVAASVKPAKPKLIKQRFESYATVGDIYAIFIGNVLLSIITFGVYSFWGRTRTRKYIASHILLDKTPFEYTGTGGELFKGFLKIYALFVVFGIITGVVSHFSHFLGAGLWIALDIALIPLIYIAIFMAFRYRLSRLNWRAIRFGLTGSAFEYMKMAIPEFLLTIITLGVLLPRMQIKLWSEMMNQAHFGNLHFDYSGDYQKLIRIHLLTFGAGFAIILLYFGLIFFLGVSGMIDEQAKGLLTLMVFPFILLARIPRFWYKAKLRDEELIGLRLGKMRFKNKASGKDMFLFSFINALILIFTLGLGYPIILKRRIDFQTKFTLIAGDLGEVVSQAPKRKAGVGGVLSEMDLGAGFDLGM